MEKVVTKPLRTAKPLDEKLLLAYAVIVCFGLVMVYSISSIMAESRFGSHMYFFRSQLMWAVLSGIAVYTILRLDLRRLAVYSAPLLLVILVMLAVVFVMPARNGSHRWIFLGPLTVQPSEMFKFVLMVYLAFSLSNQKRNLADLKQLLFPYVPIIGAGLLLILLEPNLGTTIAIFLSALGVFSLAGIRIKHLLTALVPLVGVASLVVFVLGYKKQRVYDFLDSVVDPLSGGYQVKQAALTLGAGGVFGAGLGEGRQKLFFLPYPHTDFIFASIGEEIGLIGLLFVLAAMFFLLYRGMRIASAQPDRFGYLLASGMVISLFVNMAINLGVVTSLLPVTGLPLPFLSYGGSSLLVSSASVAVLLNLSRRSVA